MHRRSDSLTCIAGYLEFFYCVALWAYSLYCKVGLVSIVPAYFTLSTAVLTTCISGFWYCLDNYCKDLFMNCITLLLRRR